MSSIFENERRLNQAYMDALPTPETQDAIATGIGIAGTAAAVGGLGYGIYRLFGGGKGKGKKAKKGKPTSLGTKK